LLSKNSDEQEWCGKAKLGYGKCYDRMGQPEEAISILEENLQEAEAGELGIIVEMISKELIQIYYKMAESAIKSEQNIEVALSFYEKCLEVSRKADREEEESQIYYRIGLLYYQNENYYKAIENQNKYLEINQNP